MTILRTICPTCDVVRVRARDAILRDVCDESAAIEFDCPRCSSTVVQRLHARIVPMLLSAGCIVADAPRVAGHGDITEAEIADFVGALDRVDWADELISGA